MAVMAKKPAKPAPVFAVGDRVEIMHFGPGKITELRGPLGPGGAQVYRVAYRLKPRPAYIEVLGSQLRPADAVTRPKAAEGHSPSAAGTPDGV
jgi:hypothetical protein